MNKIEIEKLDEDNYKYKDINMVVSKNRFANCSVCPIRQDCEENSLRASCSRLIDHKIFINKE